MKRIALTVIAALVVITAVFVHAMVPEQVRIDSGLVAGTASGQPTVRVFKGIPFAAPPLGENRWKAPQPVAKWDGVRKADAFGAPCAAGAGGGRGGVAAAEQPPRVPPRRLPLHRLRHPASPRAPRTACISTSGRAQTARTSAVR